MAYESSSLNVMNEALEKEQDINETEEKVNLASSLVILNALNSISAVENPELFTSFDEEELEILESRRDENIQVVDSIFSKEDNSNIEKDLETNETSLEEKQHESL